jgi:hypothetical protein
MSDEDLRERLARYAETLPVQVPAAGRAIQRARRNAVRRVLVTSVAVSAVTSGAIFGAVRLTSTPQTHNPSAASITLFGDAPIPRGAATTLAAAESKATFSLRRPNDELASDDSITHVWLSSTDPQQAAIEYRSGVLVLLEEAQFADPATRYAEVAKEFGSSYVTVIGDAPALVIYGASPDVGGAIDMVIKGVRVQIRSRETPLSLDELLRIAKSVDQA